MENPDSEETKAFVDEQNKLSTPFINSCSDREKIKEDLTGLWNYEKFGCPHREGNRYFFTKNSGLQNQRFVILMF